jgi:ribonuclease PH
MRSDGRANDQLRPVTFIPHYLDQHPASVLVQMGKTWVLCVATVTDEVPFWLRNQAQGWLTAEYSLLPTSTRTRTQRETGPSGVKGRTHEIQRLIGRSLRAALDLRKLGEHTITIDCDVIQADGGTRTAAITGGYVALVLALHKLAEAGAMRRDVWRAPVAAISVGMVQGEAMLDLCYQEDWRAEVDCNVVMNARAQFIEVQGTAEGQPFARAQLDALLNLADKGIKELLAAQKKALENS